MAWYDDSPNSDEGKLRIDGRGVDPVGPRLREVRVACRVVPFPRREHVIK